MTTDWTPLKSALEKCPVIAVLTVHDAAHAVPLARALSDAGMSVVEITLRTDCALEVIRNIAVMDHDLLIGGGTALTPLNIEKIAEAGGRFAVSPGATGELLAAGASSALPFIPGVATVTEAMAARDAGYRLLKFFPAGPLGGAAVLKAFSAPLYDLVFCPTGGIDADNMADYLALPNVAAVGGSWMVPGHLLAAARFEEIGNLARGTVEQVRRLQIRDNPLA